MLVVDGSGSISSDNFDTLIEIVVQVTRKYVIGPESTHMGLIQFNEQSDLEIGLGNIMNDGELERAIRNIVQNGGNTNTGEAIRQATNQLFNSPQARDNVSKFMFMFTDGVSNNQRDTENAAIDARNMGIQITAVGINVRPESTAESHLSQITGSNYSVLLVQNFNEEQLNAQSCPSM